MSRRKQARPIRHLESEEGLASSLQNGESSGTGSEDEGGGSGSGDEHICGRCRAEFLDLPDFLSHKKECGRKPVVLAVSEDVQSDSEELLLRSGEEVDEGDQGDEEKQCEESEKEREDVENNNQQLLLPPPLKQEPRQGVDSLSDSREGSVEKSEDAAEGEDKDSALRTSLNNFMNFSTVNNLPQLFPFAPGIPATNVTLEALQNTKVAVAQFAATTMANNANNAAALQELAVLQSTLYTLQHQQMLQLQLIQQLQQQLQITRSKEGSPVSPCSTSGPDRSTPVSVPTTPVLSTSVPASGPPKTTPTSTSPAPTLSVVPSSIAVESQQPPKPPPSPPTISSSLASCIITNTDPPPLNEPNTLEMLQRRAQEVLDSASQGLLANNLADDLSFRKGKSPNVLSPYDQKSGRNEPFFKHRCRYCGKVFGSDSALQIHIRSHTVRGNTTCNICFKTFACNSALEIHYRSHTKERPFKCTICERGFSTKGNSDPLHAQPNHECNCDHWGQWRIQQGDSGGNFSPQKPKRPRKRNEDSRKKGGSKKYTARLPPLLCNSGYAPDWNPLAGHPFLGNMKQHMLTHKIRDMPSHLFEANKPSDEGNLEEARPPLEMKPDLGMKRSPPEGEGLLPIPKRPPGLPKHLCHVCNKNFSSSSALQIHMRTHTGDKPFKCTICQKAFTTKGNLKVHMGTHMWSNGTSRRGRRMSLDLPPIPMTPKDSEFLQRRPDLFYPYLPAPFLNGMQQKLNEISVIQSANSNPGSGMTSPTAKFGALGFGGFEKHMTESPRSQPSSPLSDKPPSSPMVASHQSPSREGSDVEGREGLASAPPPNSGVWDLHYEQRLGSEERKANSEEVMETEVGSPGHATPHSESLVA